MSGTELSNQEKLEEVYEMTLENNQILRGMRKEQRIANAFRFLYWFIILGALGGAYYYVRPVIAAVTGDTSKIQETVQQFNNLRESLPESKLLDKIIHGFSSSNATSTEPR
jgi:hypothetical protein